MKIGIYSGMFDPLHVGHAWVIEQGCKIFDELHVVIGPNPAKPYPWFTEENRKVMIEDATPWMNVKVSILQEPRLIDYANKLAKEKHVVTVIRGVRDVVDYYTEESILKCMREKAYSGVEFVYFYAPEIYKKISSTVVKNWAYKDRWDCVEAAVHRVIGRWLVKKRYGDDPYYANKFNKLNSIFETTTAGFAPEGGMPCDCFIKNPEPAGYPNDDMCSLQQMASGDGDLYAINYAANPDLESVRHYFDKAVENGLIELPKVLNSQQVSYMIDDCKYDVISSTEFRLMKIPINSVKPTGSRYQSCSTSVGPIIVDRNFYPKDDPWNTIKHPALIIEGKHRWLDAVERGEDYIWAWVGTELLEGDNPTLKDLASNWIVCNPPVASIFETSSVGFSPDPSEKFISKPHVLETENGRVNLQVLGTGLDNILSSSGEPMAPE